MIRRLAASCAVACLTAWLAGCSATPAPSPAPAGPSGGIPAAAADPSMMTPGGY